jgi:hypothetical protein
MAIAYAKELARKRGRPVDLDLALGFLPLVAVQRIDEYDGWTLRWLGRWINEAPGSTIDQAAELAAALADLPSEPSAWEGIRAATSGRREERA